MISQRIRPSSTVESALKRFLDEVGGWAEECVARYADAEATDCHDQGTYTTGWEPWVRERDDGVVLAFLKETRDRIRDHFVEQGDWEHGYWRIHEAHHGTEHFELFLGALARLDPGDGTTAAQILDVAEHVGNWVDEIPDWFDRDRRRFLGIHFGADGVRSEDAGCMNIPDHIRFASIALLAHRVSDADRYLEFASLYLGEWAGALLSGDSLPVALGPKGPVYELSEEDEERYRSFVGMLPRNMDEPVDRAENLLASNAPGALLRTWELTGEERFKRAAERILDVLATQLGDPDAGAAADAILSYRLATGDTRYDDAVAGAVRALSPWGFDSMTLDASQRLDGRPSGIGKRADMLRWLEDGEERRHNPLLLAAAAIIRDDRNLAARALDLGRTCLSLAREVLPDGRDHGCSARSVSAVARGHGRENHAGVTTAVLAPLLECFGD
jgi:hypothetical protein